MITPDDVRHRVQRMRENWARMAEARNLFDRATSEQMRNAAFERRQSDIATLLQVVVNEISVGHVAEPAEVCRAAMTVYDEYDGPTPRWEHL